MKICILGWYGTETLGDRAILDGIIRIFNGLFEKNVFYLGSLFPFFTERTIYEDKDLLFQNIGKNDLVIFDSKNIDKLRGFIVSSNLVIMGGGPLMDLEELFLIRKGFTFARKNNIKTCLFGCGVGPLENHKYIKVVKEILSLTDLAIFRDKQSEIAARNLAPKSRCVTCFDPAIYSVLSYKSTHEKKLNESVCVVNLRQQPLEYNPGFGMDETKLIELLDLLCDRFETVNLVPNHTFFIGGDDREYMGKLASLSDKSNLDVLFKPPSLSNLYNILLSATACIGMRYHSVLMQTFLCGNNYIIDYTAPVTGKTSAFIDSLPDNEFYNNRYLNYTITDEWNLRNIVSQLCKREYYMSSFSMSIETYKELIYDIV